MVNPYGSIKLNSSWFYNAIYSFINSIGQVRVMKKIFCLISPLFLMVIIACSNSETNDQTKNISVRPNILIILADDLGYTDLGVYGGEIKTPNLDNLAQDGFLLTNFYSAPSCSPARAMMLTGTDNHLAGVGTMNGSWDTNQLGKRGYEAHLNKDVVTVSSLLQDSGYHTYLTGKWHLGYTPDLQPQSRGFEKSFILLQGGASHFNDLRGLVRGVNSEYLEDGKAVELPEDFYSSNHYTDKMIDYIEEGRKDARPFFGYLSYTAPHWPLHALDEDIDLYKGRYDQGYEHIRQNRIEKLKDLGIINKNTIASMAPPYIDKWDDLTPDQKKIAARKMEIFAAMVENMDRNIGRMITYLKETNQYENTFIFFMSDNGAEGNDIEYLSDNKVWIPEAFDNGYDNMGKENSYIYYGAEWAHVGSGPFRDFKTFVSEGGIKVPTIIRYGDLSYKNHIDHEVMTVKDITPTILELANVTHPGTKYKGRDVYPVTGRSLLPHFKDINKVVYQPTDIIGWQLFGRQAIRQGNWKMVTQAPPIGTGDWQLYNLEDDPTEINDLASHHPEKIVELTKLWEDYKSANNIILPINGENPYALPK
jgi:arylsulfatase A-like enzyme